MKKSILCLFLSLFLAGGQALLPPGAEAARFGGGRSFGGSPSFSRPAPPMRMPAQPGGFQQAQPGQGLGASARGGLGGGFFGPLLAGSLLGALFFGGNTTEGAAAEGTNGGLGISLLDILALALLVMFASRFFRRRAATPAGRSSSAGRTAGTADNAWTLLRDATRGGRTAGNGDAVLQTPAAFDRAEFLEGAKLLYARLQEAWDKRDLEDIAQFATPDMCALLREQLAREEEPSNTEILTLEADLYSFAAEEGADRAAVYFDALLREYAGKTAANAREIWHFIREGRDGVWKLDGIQQVEGPEA
jgi:predicted lipid-binding transport protein (Tim44 family)